MKRRTFIKSTLGGMFTLGLLSAGTYFYAKEIEPKRVSLSNFNISSKKIPIPFNNFKIVQFSDTHIGFYYDLQQLKQLVKLINKQNPDLIVFTGDLIDQPNKFTKNEGLISLLKTLDAPQGKFWVYGNHDHGGYGTDIVNNIMERSGFTLLKNEHAFIRKNNEQILLAGIDDVILGNPQIKTALPNKYSGEDFTILLSHAPDLAEDAVHFPIDVQLSGHSHGGQIRLPLIGHLYTPIFAKKYVHGKYSLRKQDFFLYVNRGIGTTRLPLRLFCTPEISSYTLQTR